MIVLGSTARLKSGGPLMTVSHIFQDQDGLVACTWFPEGSDEPKAMSFHKEALMEAQPEPKKDKE